jgi:hypothetical protein
MSLEYEFTPWDQDYFAQEMEAEALDALHAEQFTVFGTCKACLNPRELEPTGMCHSCQQLDFALGGSLNGLLTSN